jgi:hypothetical protein
MVDWGLSREFHVTFTMSFTHCTKATIAGLSRTPAMVKVETGKKNVAASVAVRSRFLYFKSTGQAALPPLDATLRPMQSAEGDQVVGYREIPKSR